MTDAIALIGTIAPGASVRELTSGSAKGRNQVFRAIEEDGRVTVVKIYGNAARERRERHALEAVSEIPGVPRILDRGITADGVAWMRLTDGGGWSINSLTLNHDILMRAGEVLARVHASSGSISNSSGMDGDYVATHYQSTVERLARFRRKLNLPADVLNSAVNAPPPTSSRPTTVHARPTPDKFLVNDVGDVMLVDWEWATLAPPEWDISLATWSLRDLHGDSAVEYFLKGYGRGPDAAVLDSWTAYHAATKLLEAAESRDGRLPDLRPVIETLTRAVGLD